jgi:hypothetical protein
MGHISVWSMQVNLLGENINIIKKNTALLVASKEVGLEVNTEKINYSVCSYLLTSLQDKIMYKGS